MFLLQFFETGELCNYSASRYRLHCVLEPFHPEIPLQSPLDHGSPETMLFLSPFARPAAEGPLPLLLIEFARPQ